MGLLGECIMVENLMDPPGSRERLVSESFVPGDLSVRFTGGVSMSMSTQQQISSNKYDTNTMQIP